MIDISKMRLYPFFTNNLAVTSSEDGQNYNIIFYPENTTFSSSYQKMRLKRRFVRYGTVLPSKIPRIIVTGRSLAPFYSNKILPIKSYKPYVKNMFIDTSLYLEFLDKKYGRGSYRRPIVSRKILSYLMSAPTYYPNRKNVLLYYVDLNQPISEALPNKRSWPLFMMFRKKGELPFDYVLLGVNSGGAIKYSLLATPENRIQASRFFVIIRNLKSIRPSDDAAHKDKESEEFSNTVVDTIQSTYQREISDEKPEDITKQTALVDRKVKYAVKKYIETLPETTRIKMIHQDSLSPQDAQRIAIKSVLFSVTRDMDKAERLSRSVKPQNYQKVLRNIKNDIAPDILVEDSYKNESRDRVFGKININGINDGKNPSRILSKRKVDFQQSFEKDLKQSFKLLAKKKDFPLNITKFSKKPIPIDPGDLEPTKMVKYSITLKDDKGKDHAIEIDIPQIQTDGTFLINGKKKYLVYQMVIDPIFFMKPGEAVLQTMFASVATHHKKTKHKSYFTSYIAGYWLPTFLLMSYYIGFSETCKIFSIDYSIENKKPKEENVKLIELGDGKYLVLKPKNEESIILINSLYEISTPFSSKDIESKDTFRDLIIKETGNRNCIFQIDKVLENIMEPIALQVLKTKLLPTTFSTCIHYICKELAKGRVDSRNDIGKQRVRSSEIINYQIQKLIIGAYNDYQSKREHGDKDAVYYCDTRQIVNSVVNDGRMVLDLENINPYEELSCMTRVSPIGPGGVSDRHGVTKAARNLNSSYFGNIDPMDTPENASVGITNHLSLDSAIGNSRGSFGKFNKDDIGSSILGTSSAIIPYVSSCDGCRVMMGSGQTRQTIPILGSEPPICQTGFETIMTSMLTDSYIKKAPMDGVITRQSENIIYVKSTKTGRDHPVPLDKSLLKSAQGKSSLNYFRSVVRDNQTVKKGQILAEGKHIKDGVISVGTNLLVALMGWKGYSFEDGYVISERVAQQKFQSSAYEEITVNMKTGSIVKFIAEEGKMTEKGEQILIWSSKNVEDLLDVEEDEIVEGQPIKKSPGGKIISIEVYPNVSIKKFPMLIKPFMAFKKRYEETKGKFPEKFLVNEAGNKVPFSGVRIVFKIERYDNCIVGDKITNNHGGKGVITLIEKTENMPITPWGDPIDIILNPIAIINRMNPSVLYEMYTGLISKFLTAKIISFGYKKNNRALKLIDEIYTSLDITDKHSISRNIVRAFKNLSDRGYTDYIKHIESQGFLPMIVPPFKTPNKEIIRKTLGLVGARIKYPLKLPEYGTRTKNSVAVGYLYYKKLEQQAAYKISARSIGKYDTKTSQPVAGMKKGGGQRIGEFDTWALASHGAEMVLRELLGPLSDDKKTKDQILFDIIHTGEANYREPKAGIAKTILDIYMTGMMLEVEI